MTSTLLLQVKDSFSLTGLGVLLLPAGTEAALERLDLHTVWAAELVWPDGRRETATVSVEEITRPGAAAGSSAPSERGLLLTHDGAAPVPAGTQVWARASPKT